MWWIVFKILFFLKDNALFWGFFIFFVQEGKIKWVS